MRLSPEDQAEYRARLEPLEELKRLAVSAHDTHQAKKFRQAIGRLYEEFKLRELPPDPPTAWEREMAMTLEHRIERIEQHLGLGRYKETE